MANETSGRRDNRVPFRASTKTPNIMMLRRTRFLLIVCGILAFAVLGIKLFSLGFCPVVAFVLNSEQHQDVQFWYFIVNVLDISAVLAEFFSVVPVFRT